MPKLGDLDDVDGSDPTTTGDMITWNQTSGVWERGISNVNDFHPKFDGEPNGFENRNDVSLSYDEGTRTLTITPTGTSYTIWANGTKYVKDTVLSLAHDDIEGQWHYYFDNT